MPSSSPALLAALVVVTALAPSPARAQGAEALRPQAVQAPVQDLLTVDLRETRLTIGDLVGADFDVTAVRPGGQVVEVLATADEQARLLRLGVPFDLEQADLASFLEARLAAGGFTGTDPDAVPMDVPLDPPFGQGSMGGYYTFDELVSVLDQLAAAHPSIMTARASIGTSIQGRDLWMVKVSDNPGVDEAEPEVRFDALHHSREPQSMQTVLWFLIHVLEEYGEDPEITWLVDNRELYFVPCVNPDGYVYNQSTNPGGGGLWRKNRRNNGGSFGVDLNRNYPFAWGFDDVGSSPTPSSETYRGTGPASEPETAAMVAFMVARDFATALTCHSYSNLWLYPWGYVATPPANEADYIEVSNLATEVNGYTVQQAIDLYPTNGTTDDHDHAQHGTMSWTPEIGSSGDNFWPPQSRIVPLAQENVLACKRTALAAGAWTRLLGHTVTEVGDGDGFFEAGETVELVATVRNTGLDATAGAVTVQLSTTSPAATVTTSSAGLGALASFSQATHAGTPLALAIDGGAADGTVIPWTLEVVADGRVVKQGGTLITGAPTVHFFDDMEADLGWTVGLPGDTATTGIWVRDDPIGTTSGGEDVQPEDDTTPNPGVTCFVTGNGSTSAGGDDVDNGHTTLISPALDLSSVAAARITYERWFADLSTADDTFDVSVSDDGGASWTTVESVSTTQNVWTTRSFLVNDFVDLTSDVRVRFLASDDPNNSLVEAAVDDFLVEVWTTAATAAPGARRAGPALRR